MIRWIKTVWYVLNLRCEEADRIRAISTADDLTRAERLGERMHSALCASCRRARRQARALQRILREIGSGDAGPNIDPATRARIRAALENKKST